MIENILKETTIKNKKFLTSNILNDDNKITTLKKPKINNSNNILKEPKIKNNEQWTIINDNLEKTKINKKLTSNKK